MSVLRIDTSVDTFKSYRQRNNYYIDKTGFIERFLNSGSRVTVFTRPRRFGKTMLISMLAEFFDLRNDSQSIFSNLKISKNKELCDTWMNKYPVIFISLKGIDGKSFDDAIVDIKNKIEDLYSELEDVFSSTDMREVDRLFAREILERRETIGTLNILCLCLEKFCS